MMMARSNALRDGPGRWPAASPLTACAACDARPFSVCSAIHECDLGRLAAVAEIVEIAPGQTFVDEGEAARHFFNITRGTVKIFKLLPDGRRQITGFLDAGDFLGLAVDRTYAFSAEAIDTVRLCRFERPKLIGLLDEFPAFERQLLKWASHELLAAQNQMLLLGRKTARERVASFLLTRNRRRRPGRVASTLVSLPMNRTDIGDYLGLTIETVSRTITRLKRDGLIRLHGSDAIELLDPAGLESIAEGFGAA